MSLSNCSLPLILSNKTNKKLSFKMRTEFPGEEEQSDPIALLFVSQVPLSHGGSLICIPTPPVGVGSGTGGESFLRLRT